MEAATEQEREVYIKAQELSGCKLDDHAALAEAFVSTSRVVLSVDVQIGDDHAVEHCARRPSDARRPRCSIGALQLKLAPACDFAGGSSVGSCERLGSRLALVLDGGELGDVYVRVKIILQIVDG